MHTTIRGRALRGGGDGTSIWSSLGLLMWLTSSSLFTGGLPSNQYYRHLGGTMGLLRLVHSFAPPFPPRQQQVRSIPWRPCRSPPFHRSGPSTPLWGGLSSNSRLSTLSSSSLSSSSSLTTTTALQGSTVSVSFERPTVDENGTITPTMGTTMVIGKKKVLRALINGGSKNETIITAGTTTTTTTETTSDNPSSSSSSSLSEASFWDDLPLDRSMARALLDSIGGKSGTASSLMVPITEGDTPNRVVLGVLPDSVSRNNHPWTIHTVTDMVSSNLAGKVKKGSPMRLIFVGDEALQYQGALTCAISRAFPSYSRKTTKSSRRKGHEKQDHFGNDADVKAGNNDHEESEDENDNSDDDDEVDNEGSVLYISFVDDLGMVVSNERVEVGTLRAAFDGIQLAARLVDMTPAELTTDAYAEECKDLVVTLTKEGHNVTMREIVGNELDRLGYGGIYGVGKAAECPPRLVIMEYTPPSSTDDESIAESAAESAGATSPPPDDGTTHNATTTTSAKCVALVGKAIVYDTGGLSLKSKTGMSGMKTDMGGSAGVLGGFVTAVRAGYPHRLVLLLCMAENAIGPTAFRNDDILTLYSGKTVEVNNCDAEGRLVLGDGVAHATQNIPNVDLVVDMATLTGAQMVATGQKHAGILANSAELEQRAVLAGLRSGDLVYPLLYAPDLLMKEFNSKVADMKNSVKDRSNAQSSCAGHFIESHLAEDYKGGWLHVDMAGPSTNGDRGTGYGVGLVLSLLGIKGFC